MRDETGQCEYHDGGEGQRRARYEISRRESSRPVDANLLIGRKWFRGLWRHIKQISKPGRESQACELLADAKEGRSAGRDVVAIAVWFTTEILRFAQDDSAWMRDDSGWMRDTLCRLTRLKTKMGTAVPCPYFGDQSLLAQRLLGGRTVDVILCSDLELAGGWGLLFLVLTAVRLAPFLLGLALFRRQQSLHLLVRAHMDAADFGLLLIGAQRRVVVHGGDLRLGAFVDFLHLRFLIIGQV